MPRQAAERNRRSHQDLQRGRRIRGCPTSKRAPTCSQVGPSLSRSLGLDRCGALAVEEVPPAIEPSPPTTLQDPIENQPFLRFRDSALSADHAMGAVTGQERRRHRSAHAQKAEFYVQQISNAISPSEFRLHQSRSTARDAGPLERRQSGARHERWLAEDIEPDTALLRIRQSDPVASSVASHGRRRRAR